MLQQLLLDPDAVRLRASSIEGCKHVPSLSTSIHTATTSSSLSYSGASSCVSFLVGVTDDNDSNSKSNAVESLARVTVFVDTATICISRVDPTTGSIRHVFRKSVTSLDAIERILRHPPTLTRVDRTIIGLVDTDNEEDEEQDNEEDEDFINPSKILQRELEFAEVGIAILKGEQSKLEHHLHSLTEEREGHNKQLKEGQILPVPVPAAISASVAGSIVDTAKPLSPQQQPSSPVMNAVAAKSLQVNTRTSSPGNRLSTSQTASTVSPPITPALTPSAMARAASPEGQSSSNSWNKEIGVEFQFSLSAASMKHVDQCMSDITGMNKLIRGVATNGRGTVFLYGNGGVAYTPNIPRPLHQKLSALRSNSKMSSRPSYISLGSKERYYCSFHDGTYSVKGPKSLEKELKKLTTLPISVSFGGTWEAWFVVFSDGSWKFQGKIPAELSYKLGARKDRGDLIRVSLGPSGEWFLKARNGRMWWGGLTEAADAAIEQVVASHELCSLDFGEDGSYFVSYD